MRILAIDPGCTLSAYVLMDEYIPIQHGKVGNDNVLYTINTTDAKLVVIERVASYGMPVGREVFETCEWIGRFAYAAEMRKMDVAYIYRRDEKMALCHNLRANDATIRRALIDRFATFDLKTGKGTARHPDTFYGFSADVWQAYAVGATYLEGVNGNGDYHHA